MLFATTSEGRIAAQEKGKIRPKVLSCKPMHRSEGEVAECSGMRITEIANIKCS